MSPATLQFDMVINLINHLVKLSDVHSVGAHCVASFLSERLFGKTHNRSKDYVLWFSIHWLYAIPLSFQGNSVKIFDKRNPVYFSAQEAWERYANHLEGMLSGPVCVISSQTLASAATKALEASAKALEYGQSCITYVTLTQRTVDDEQEQTTLSGKQLFGIIEAIDPLVLIATDSQAVAALSHAYHVEFPTNGPARLFGRNAVGFVDFANMLNESDEKQRAWAHLKRLGHKPKPK